MHDLVWPWRTRIAREGGLIFMWRRNDGQKIIERNQILVECCVDRLLNEVVARNEGWVDRAHGRSAFFVVSWFFGQTPPPLCSPAVEGGGVVEEAADRPVGSWPRARNVAKPTEREREVGMVLCHAVQEILCER